MDTKKIRNDFPILNEKVNGKTVTYLDNSATSQKPLQVIEAMDEFYKEYNANVHRGVYYFSEHSTEKYEKAREKLKYFINADGEIIFTKNATEAINLVAYSWGEANIRKGDKIVVSILEHHSNLVPWQQLAERKGAKLEYIDINQNTYELDELEFEKISGAKIVAITHISNVLGTINPVKKICKIARENGAISLIDGAQSVPHMKVDVTEIGCDFLALTGHKMLGPTGIGALYGKTELLEKMRPFLYGGDMIREVRKDKSVWNDLPYKFEAGTPNISGAIGLGAAIEYLEKIGMEEIRKHEMELIRYAIKILDGLDGIKLYGTRKIENRGGVLPFNLDNLHSHDVAALLDDEGIAIRSGHHCAMPLHTQLQIDSTNRASFYLYNEREEIDRLAKAIEKAKHIFDKVK